MSAISAPQSPSPIRSEVDLDADGKHAGYLRVPHSVHRSAYGWLPVPIVSIRNGDGPVVLIMAGNHGDEYEGQILVSQLILDLEAEDIQGQLIFLPAANAPAAEAGLRTSPVDGGNLNRSFPGNPDGTPTQIIAHYIEHTLLKRADYLVDLHSGGSSLLYGGANMLAIDPRDSDEREKIIALLNAFGLPNAFLHKENPAHAAMRDNRQLAFTSPIRLCANPSRIIFRPRAKWFANVYPRLCGAAIVFSISRKTIRSPDPRGQFCLTYCRFVRVDD